MKMRVRMVCTKEAPKSWRYEPVGVEDGVKGTLYVAKMADGFGPGIVPRYIDVEISIPETITTPQGESVPTPKGVHPNYAAATPDPLKF